MKSIHTHLFRIVSILCILYFLYNLYRNSILTSFVITAAAWSTVVIATPIPSGALLLSFPMKIFLGIPLYISQIIVSVLAIGILFFYMNYAPAFVKTIFQKNMYSIFGISIVCSVLLSKLLDHLHDYYNKKQWNLENVLLLTISSGILLYMYKLQIDSL
jgi:hypothetical protein